MALVNPEDLVIGQAYRTYRACCRDYYFNQIYLGRKDISDTSRGTLVFRDMGSRSPGSYSYIRDELLGDYRFEEITDQPIVNRMGALRKKNSPYIRKMLKELNPRSYMNLDGLDMGGIAHYSNLAAARLANPTTAAEVAYKQRAPLLAHRQEHTFNVNNSSKGGKRRKTARKTRNRAKSHRKRV